MRDERRAQVAQEGDGAQALVREAAALCVRERDETHRRRARNLGGFLGGRVLLLQRRRERSRNLGGAQACGED